MADQTPPADFQPNSGTSSVGSDIADQLTYLMGDTGGLQDLMGGFRLKVYHTLGFPWAEVFKLLLYRDFKVDVRRHKADIFIEART